MLLIGDSPADETLVVEALTRGGYDVAHQRVNDSEALTAALGRRASSIAIVDATVTGVPAAVALDLIRVHDADLPCIVIADWGGDEAVVAAMRCGARDFILKRHLERLAPAVDRELGEAGARRERRRAEKRLAYLAYHDPLTDLPNRLLLHDRLAQALRVAARTSTSLALLILDLNGFKEINDTLGHHAGDRLLQCVASRVRGMLRDADTVARLGGDEFAIVLPVTDVNGALLTAEKVLHEIEQPCVIDHRALSVRSSLGISCFPEHGTSAEALLQRADVAMYVAKSDRVGIAVYAPSQDRHTHRRLTLISELRTGLDENQFTLEYQPIVHLPTNVVTGVEALVRWNHPKQGRVMPDGFIHLAEQTGLINPLTTIILETAIREWSQPPPVPPLTVAVNLSPRTLQDPGLPRRIADMLAVYGAPPQSLALEITENILMSDPVRSMDCLKGLHEMGVRIVIDDFGTGYSSLSYLRRLPVDELKIDRSFITGLLEGADDVIVRSTIDLAHNLGLTVVAEGVESDEVHARLMALGCDAVQGTFIRAPAPMAEVRAWIGSQNLLGLM
ncbi:MAG: diguanylate cyclase [Acidobacteria bacterium]|nr:diguanylate cyclase [Acidobacteriota bacterium]